MEISTQYCSLIPDKPTPLCRRLSTVIAAITCLVLASVSSFSYAAPGGIPGRPGDGGGGGAAPDFGDLIILYRDNNGVPIPSPEVEVEDPETGQLVDGGLCWQPIAFEPATCGAEPIDPIVVNGEDVYLVPVDQYNCSVDPNYSSCTREVEFGRINAARSPDEVFDRQVEDAVINLSTADCVTLDPAGRLVANKVDDTSLDNLAKTIDSPLQNLAIYRELMLNGYIGTAPGLSLPDGNIFNTAARGLGAGSDKSGGVNVDLVAYLNQIMGLSDPDTPTVIGKLCETYREEVQGVIQEVEKCFLNYGTDNSDILPAGAAYDYTRAANFLALPEPEYIPEGAAMDGWFEYLAVVAPDALVPQFQIDQGLIQNAVFCVDADGNSLAPVFGTSCDAIPDPGPGAVAEYTGGNIGAFAQAADDARAVISFMHSWQVPVNYETELPCEASDSIFYDLSISEQSGLQVPTRYVNNKEREFFVNVTNLGPDTANGVVTVVATNGVKLGEWSFPFVDLPSGQTVSNTQQFIINTTSDSINWTATVEAGGPGTDPNPANNSVSATSIVSNPGGGGGGNGGQGGNPN